VHGLAIGTAAGAQSRPLKRLRAPAQRRVVGNGQSKAEETDDRANQTFGLAQSQPKHSPQRQRRQDRQRRIPGLPPRVVRHAAIATSVNQTVKLPRWRKLASYAAQVVTLRFCFGMWWRREALALNGMRDSGSEQGMPPIPIHLTSPIADPCNNVPPPSAA
jgi:hypothetical protein